MYQAFYLTSISSFSTSRLSCAFPPCPRRAVFRHTDSTGTVRRFCTVRDLRAGVGRARAAVGDHGGNGYLLKGTCAKASKAAAEVPSEVPSAPPNS